MYVLALAGGRGRTIRCTDGGRTRAPPLKRPSLLSSVVRQGASVTPTQSSANGHPNEETPARGERGASQAATRESGLRVDRELSSIRLLKPGLLPFALISRRIAENIVAFGVLPPGLVQSPFFSIAASSSLQAIGSLASAKTFAAALMALNFLGAASLAGLAAYFGAAFLGRSSRRFMLALHKVRTPP